MLELELPLSNKTSRVTNLTHCLSLLLATNHLPVTHYPLRLGLVLLPLVMVVVLVRCEVFMRNR